MNTALADDAEKIVRPHGLEHIIEDDMVSPQHLWDIIGDYTAKSLGTEKFIRPANDCNLLKDLDKDYLMQLELCKEQRKGWLKI
jgi:hypothetical protein